LVFGALQGHVTSPLVSDNSVIHCPANNIQDFRIEEKLRSEARALKRHWHEVPTRPTVRVSTIHIFKQKRPKRFAASLNYWQWKMPLKHAKPVL